MRKKGLLISMILLNAGLIGCKNENVEMSVKKPKYSAPIEKVKEKHESVRVSYKDFKIDLPKTYEHSNVEDADIFKINDRESNISIKYLDIEGVSIETYKKKALTYITERLKGFNIKENEVKINGFDSCSIEYKYKANKEDIVYVQQVFLKKKETIYIITLLSNEKDYKNEKIELKKILDSIK